MGDQSEPTALDAPIPPDAPEPSARNVHPSERVGLPPAPLPSRAARSRGKRLLDLATVLAVAPLVVPICLVIAFLVACTSRGGVLFVQERVGLGGKPFRMVKFRTMRAGAEASVRADPELWAAYVSNDFKLPAEADTRVTPVGHALRRTSLDELPQLINVVKNEMSLVGPRPVVAEELAMHSESLDAYLSTRPGITGTWQVNGRSGVSYPERAWLEREYVEHWRLWLDVKCLLRTPLVVLSRRGAH